MTQPTPTDAADALQRDGRLLIWLMKPFCRLELPANIEIRTDRPTIVMANHRSLLDVFCAAAFCHSAQVSCRVFVNARYFRSRVAGAWLRRIGAIPLDRHSKEEAFAEARKSLERGELVGIMPEGRLVPPEEREHQTGPARPGAAELAAEMNAYMRAVVFHNTDVVWPRDKWPRLSRRRPVVTMELDHLHFEPTGNHQDDIDIVMARLTVMLDELDADDRL